MSASSRLALVPLGLLVAAAAWLSLAWRATLDAPYMMFLPYEWAAYGLAPYAGVYDHNAPGGFLLSGVAYGLVGSSDAGLRAIDLGWLAATIAAGAWALRGLGPAALAGPLLFALFYLDLGPLVAFQREYQLLLPLFLAMGLTNGAGASARPGARAFGAGALAAAAATIKPAAAIALLGLAAWWWLEAPAARRRVLLLFAAGAAAVLAVTAAALAALGGLGAYLDIVAGYYPLYNQLDGDNTVRAGADRWRYDLAEVRAYLGGKKRWLVFAATGLAAGWWATAGRPGARRLVACVAAAVPAGLLYAVALGKFFDYHWLPLHAALALAAGLWALAPRGAGAIVLLAGAWLTHWPSPDVAPQWLGKPPIQEELARVDGLVAAIAARVKPGDTVQVLEWTNGGAQAALRARVRTATPFYQDFMFYHHVSSPYVQGLRRRFLAAFDAARPALVVRVQGDEPAVFGPDTEARWAELEERLGRDYVVAEKRLGYAVYARRR